MGVTSRPAGKQAGGAQASGPKSHVYHDVGGAGPIYASATSPDGRRYFSDEFHHRVVIEEPSGYRWSIGGLGIGAGEFRHPRGLAFLSGPSASAGRLFVCDAWNHRIQVFDGSGRFLLAFGSVGTREGQFDVPSDVAIVRPRFPGEELPEDPREGAWLAVADRWNNRVQVFDLDGTLVGVIGGHARRGLPPRPAPEAAGWPYFRVGIDPTTWFPVRLSWADPLLEVVSANGRPLRINLAVATLPDFETWRRHATLLDLSAARSAFAVAGRQPALPADILAAIGTDLGRRLLEAGQSAAASRAWAGQWPAGLPASAIIGELSDRVGHVERCSAGRLTGRCRRIVTALASRVRVERRRIARNIVSDRLADERQVKGGPRHVVDPTGSAKEAIETTVALVRAGELSARLAGIEGLARPDVEPVWTAPRNAGDLQGATIGHGFLAVVAAREPAVWLFDEESSPVERFSLPAGTSPRGIAPAPGRGWFVSDVQHHCVLHLGENGKIVRRWGGFGVGPGELRTPLSIWAGEGRVYVADWSHDRVQVHDDEGRVLGGYPRLGAPAAVAVADRSLWVAEWRRGGVRRLDVETGETLAVLQHPDLLSPIGVAPCGRRAVMVADHLCGAVHVFDADGRWTGRIWLTGGRPFGRLTGLVSTGRHGIAVDHDHGRLLRFRLPRGRTPWPTD